MDKALLELLGSQGYTSCRALPNGEVVGLLNQIYTCALVVGLTQDEYRSRYCYETRELAQEALDGWDGRGDPPGPWIKEKPSERLGPGATKGA